MMENDSGFKSTYTSYCINNTLSSPDDLLAFTRIA
jgi:hypothetical protein